MDEPRPRRFQFGLRALLLAFVPVAVVALPVGYYVRRPLPPQLVPVTGTVTLDGMPLDHVLVEFYLVGEDAEGVLGQTDSAGHFTVEMASIPWFVKGTFPGTYRITVRTYDEVALEAFCSLTPRRYADPATSGLAAEVTKGGPNNFSFNLVTE